MKNDKRKTSPIASLTGVGKKTRSRIRVKATFPLISGRGKQFNQMFVLQYLGCSRSWTSRSSDPEWILVEGQSLSVLNKVRSSLLGRFQTGLQGGGIPYKDFRFASLSNPIFSSGWILRFLIPVVKRKKPKTKHHQQPAFPTLNVRNFSVCTIHGVDWLFWISSSLSPPLFAFGYYRLARVGSSSDGFLWKQPRWRSFNQSFYALALMTIFGKEGMQGTSLSFPLVLESYQCPLLPYGFSLSHRFCIR